jgi:hypothetical protein
LIPLPPVPPSLDAAGNPIVDAAGNAVYATQGDALAASEQIANPNGVAPASAAGKTDWSNFSNDPLGTVGSALSNNAGLALQAGGMGLNLLRQQNSGLPSVSGLTSTLQGQAGTLNNQGQQLQSYLQSGTLPAGVQQNINQASQAAKATIRSQYASRGMSGSSAEAQDLASVDERAQSQGSQIAMQLLSQGVNEVNLSDQIYGQLLNQSVAADNALSSSISNFASSLVPKPTTGVTINTTG